MNKGRFKVSNLVEGNLTRKSQAQLIKVQEIFLSNT